MLKDDQDSRTQVSSQSSTCNGRCQCPPAWGCDIKVMCYIRGGGGFTEDALPHYCYSSFFSNSYLPDLIIFFYNLLCLI